MRYIAPWKKKLSMKIGLLGLNDVSKLAPIGDLGYMNGWYPCSLFTDHGQWMNGGMERAVYEAAKEQGYRFEEISHRETGVDTTYYCKSLSMYFHVDSSG